MWTFDMVEERLVEAVRLWWRTPGGGAWPFASDGPWHLIGADPGDYDARGGDMSGQAVVRPLALSPDEVAARDEATEWVVRFVPAADRPLVWAVIDIKAAGRTVSWLRLRQERGVRVGADGLRKRYSRGINRVCIGLTGAELRG